MFTKILYLSSYIYQGKHCRASVEPNQGGGGGGEPPTKFSKSGGLAGPKFLERVAGKEEGDFFQGGCSFYIKNELKSKIFNDKKSL